MLAHFSINRGKVTNIWVGSEGLNTFFWVPLSHSFLVSTYRKESSSMFLKLGLGWHPRSDSSFPGTSVLRSHGSLALCEWSRWLVPFQPVCPFLGSEACETDTMLRTLSSCPWRSRDCQNSDFVPWSDIRVSVKIAGLVNASATSAFPWSC